MPKYWTLPSLFAALALALAGGVLIAGLFGMGAWSVSSTSTDSSAIVQSNQPAFVTPIAQTSDYSSIALHSIFLAGHSQDTQSFTDKPKSTESISASDLSLTSILVTPQLTMVSLSKAGQDTIRLKLGDSIPGSNWQLVRVEPRVAVFNTLSGEQRFVLKVFSGAGGQAPSALMPINTMTEPQPAAVMQIISNTEPQSATQFIPPPTVIDPEAEMRIRLAARRAQLEREQNQGQK